MKKMISMLLAVLMLASLLAGLAPKAVAANPVVYTAGSNPYFARSKQDVVARYKAMLDVGSAYDNENEQSWYARMYSAVAPYDQGVLKQDTLDAMMAMTNYLRWLSGTNPLPTDVHNDDSLQRGALIRSFAFEHIVSHNSPKKPADMDQSFWNAGCDVYNNILCSGPSPRDAIVRWLNEGFLHDADDYFQTVGGIGHRMAILGSGRGSLHYGYVKKVAIGYYGLGASEWNGAFAAFPAPGPMPKEFLVACNSAWSVEPNKTVFSFEEAQLEVIVTNLETDESYTCTASDGTLYVDHDAVAFLQPEPLRGRLMTYPDNRWSVTARGLTEVKTGKPAEISYEVDLFSMERELMDFSAATLSGSCGDNVTWCLDADTMILTISGTGEMQNYAFERSTPWYPYQKWISRVEIKDGVTSIGNTAFCGCSELRSVRMANSVQQIGNCAFSGCYTLRDLQLSTGLIRIGSMAFYGAAFARVELPDGLQVIEQNAFYGCEELSEATVPSSVTVIGDRAFGYYNGPTNIELIPGFTLRGYAGSAAQTYAENHGIRFVPLPASGFYDVSDNSYYAQPVLWAVENGVTAGTGAWTFGPKDTCTRAQVMTFLWRAAGSPEPTRADNPFTDIKEGKYYYKAVLWAVEKKITAGTSSTTFGPNAPCTRGQVVTFLWRYEGEPTATTSNNPFEDVKTGAYYEKAVIWALETGITAGTSATTFSPDATCTRAQVVTFLYHDMVK